MKSGKIWGFTEEIYTDSHCEIHRIFSKAGSRCSMHKHSQKSNMFFVESGCLKIVVRKNDYDLTDETILRAGEKAIVPPGEFHRFEAIEDTVAFEIYFVKLSVNDIHREDHGASEIESSNKEKNQIINCEPIKS